MEQNAEMNCAAAMRPQMHAGEGVGERAAADTLVCSAVSGDARGASATS